MNFVDQYVFNSLILSYVCFIIIIMIMAWSNGENTVDLSDKIAVIVTSILLGIQTIFSAVAFMT